MEIIDQELSAIILKSLYFALTPEEEQKLHLFLNASDANRLKFQELTNPETLETMLARFEERNANQAANLERIRHLLREPSAGAIPRPVKRMRKWLWAAALVIIAGTAALLIERSYFNRDVAAVRMLRPKEIVPGKEGAVLTLADGRELVLDSMKNGFVASQKGAKIELDDGMLTYMPAGNTDSLLAYNTLTAPRGRFFRISLPDGTRVWLNAASSIRFPTAFSGRQRLVRISGEAYMEVATNIAQPFRVEINNQALIDVIGTRFNVSAYTDEHVSTTTLVEGALKVKLPAGTATSGSGNEVVLHPGQEAMVIQRTGGSEIRTSDADLEKTLSWRRGFFNFENQGIKEVMQSLARWYDLDIAYEGNIPPVAFQGELDRSMSLKDVLQVLEDSKIHFKLEGRKITVQP